MADFNRLFEMLSLYQAAGGFEYVALKHRYWSEMDLSESLRMKRLLIIGRVAKPIVDWKVTRNEKDVPLADGQRSAFVRIVIPVSDSK
jgi:hypothetical protein